MSTDAPSMPPQPADARIVATEKRATISIWHVAVALTIVVSAVIRLWAGTGELWLDEIWSYVLASTVDSAGKLFTEIRHDNNHHLMTLWIYLLGFEVRSLVVRAPSIVAGVATVLLAAVVARRWGRREMLIAALLTASSYVLINYSGEARGYALAGCFALLGFLTLERCLSMRRWRDLVLFWSSAAFGFLSHLTFFHFYCGAFVWSAVRAYRQSPSWRDRVAIMMRCHAIPTLFLIAFYVVSLHGMEIGGGDPPNIFAIIVKTMSLAVGGPIMPSTDQLAIAILATSSGMVALVWLGTERSDLWVFFLTTIYLSPLILLIEQPHSGLFVRYFYINIVCFLILLSYLLGRLGSAGTVGTLACVALMASIVGGNVQRLREYSVGRRGEYLATVRYIVEHSNESEIEVGTDHSRTRLVLHFYSAFVPPGRSLHHAEPAPAPAKIDQWYIAHNEMEAMQPAAQINDVNGAPFDLVRVYRHSGLSGFDWALYRRSVQPPENRGEIGH